MGISAAGVAVSILVLGITLVVLAAWPIVPFATTIPPSCATVSDTVGVALFRDPAAICNDIDLDTVWTALRSLIVEQLGVRPDEVTEDALFVGDLRAD